MAIGHLILSIQFFYLFPLKKCQPHDILIHGRWCVRATSGREVVPMTKYQFAMLMLAVLQVLIGVATLLK